MAESRRLSKRGDPGMYYCGWDGGGSTTKTLALDAADGRIAQALEQRGGKE